MRRVYQTLVLLVVLAIGIFSTVTFLNTDYFKIEKVDIKGNTELLRQDIKSHLEVKISSIWILIKYKI